MAKLVLVGVVAVLGCGGNGPAAAPTQADLVGAWTAAIDPPTSAYVGCAIAATFAIDGTFGSGISCTIETIPQLPEPPMFQRVVQWETGAYTFAADGQIDFVPDERSCSGVRSSYGHAEYAGPAARPTVTLAPPLQDIVLTPSTAMPLGDGAILGCFAADWAFTASR